jgi:hypothetical protein
VPPLAVVRKSTRPLLGVLGVIGVIAVLLMLGLMLSMLEHRYGPIDPTDPGWKAQVVNDLGAPIRLGGLTIAAGRSDIVVAPGPGALHPVYKVTDGHGRRLGCLSVTLDRNQTVRVLASTIRPCSQAR